jgi:hypothetical protein
MMCRLTTRSAWLRCLLLVSALLLGLGYDRADAQDDTRCFPEETGHCIYGRLREFWGQNGGAATFGYPLGPPRYETILGHTLLVQAFEFHVLMLDGHAWPPNDIRLRNIGEELLLRTTRSSRDFPKGQPLDGCLFFAKTSHNLCTPFLEMWRSKGIEEDGLPGFSQDESQALFGLPLSEPVLEPVGDGRQVRVQWFERARFEYDPEQEPPVQVHITALGRVLYPPERPDTEEIPGVEQLTPEPGDTPELSPDQARLKISNNTGKAVRVSLAGPTTMSWSVIDAIFDTVIAPGGYQVIVTTWCGQATSNFSVEASKTVELPISCDQSSTAEVRLVNQTDGTARLSITGATPLNLIVGERGQQTARVRPGDYSGTVTTLCGSAPINFTISANESREVALQCPEPTSTVSIVNTSAAPIRVSLVGPTPDSLTVASGKTETRSVVPGVYEAIVDSACGRDTEPFTVAAGEVYTLKYHCEPPQASTSVTNNTGGVLTLTLRGPTSGSYTVPDGATQSFDLLPGTYSATVRVRCGSEIQQFILDNGAAHSLGEYSCSKQPIDWIDLLRKLFLPALAVMILLIMLRRLTRSPRGHKLPGTGDEQVPDGDRPAGAGEKPDSPPSKELSGKEFGALRDALSKAIDHNTNELRSFVKIQLDLELYNIAPQHENVRFQIEALLRWLASANKIEDLIVKARESYPGNPELEQFEQQWRSP